jgi:biopolymer transport protein ExbB/TolQ
MSELLPWLFIAMASAAVVAAFVSLWLSLSVALSDEASVGVRAQLSNEARRALVAEKEALLQEIRDISFEHDAGKLSDADFEELNTKLRAQARHVLHQLDAGLEAFRDEAEALIARRLEERP